MTIRTLGLATLAALGLYGQSLPGPPAFEVASVKLNPYPPGSFGFGPAGGGGPGIHISGNRVTLVRNPLTRLVMTAYNVKDFQISGVPEWALGRDQFYDITAKVEGESAPALEQVRPMLQTLLADRFQLKLHRETRELPVYDLVDDKKGPKLKESIGPRSPHPVTFSGTLTRFNLLDKSLADLVDSIAGFVDRPVLDKTGLTGRYDFTLEFTHSNPDLVARDSPEADRSIFTAIQEQLGLKLTPAKAPTEILVIDHAERPRRIRPGHTWIVMPREAGISLLASVSAAFSSEPPFAELAGPGNASAPIPVASLPGRDRSNPATAAFLLLRRLLIVAGERWLG